MYLIPLTGCGIFSQSNYINCNLVRTDILYGLLIFIISVITDKLFLRDFLLEGTIMIRVIEMYNSYCLFCYL